MDERTELILAVFAREYVSWLETAITEQVCKCAWLDSGRLGPNGRPLRALSHAHPSCQVHTKEGRIIGFLKWAEEHKGLTLTLPYREDIEEALAALPQGSLSLDGVLVPPQKKKHWLRVRFLNRG